MYCNKCGRPLDENNLCAVCTYGESIDNFAIRPTVLLLIANGVFLFVIEIMNLIFENKFSIIDFLYYF